MSLAEVIEGSFQQMLLINGTKIINLTTNKEFQGLVTSGDYEATFTENDLEREFSLQITTTTDNKAKTGDFLQVEDKRFIVQTVQERPNSPICRMTAYETRKRPKH